MLSNVLASILMIAGTAVLVSFAAALIFLTITAVSDLWGERENE